MIMDTKALIERMDRAMSPATDPQPAPRITWDDLGALIALARRVSELEEALSKIERCPVPPCSHHTLREIARAALTAPLSDQTSTGAPELTADFTRALPGGLDDATYEQIESALDAIDAPIRTPDGVWLKIHERILALRPDADPTGKQSLQVAPETAEPWPDDAAVERAARAITLRRAQSIPLLCENYDQYVKANWRTWAPEATGALIAAGAPPAPSPRPVPETVYKAVERVLDESPTPTPGSPGPVESVQWRRIRWWR
jgi:hypothetical protein